jgi:ribose transport system substrate-binding protein
MKPLRLLLPLLVWIVAAVSAPADPLKIGVLLKGKNDFWAAVAKGASQAGQKLGAEVIVKSPPTEADVGIQVRLLGILASEGIQALIIAPCNKDSLARPVAALAAKGVKIVVIDSPLSGSAGYVFVGTDQRAAGQAAGRLVAGLVTEGDEVAILRHVQGGGAPEMRESAALAELLAAHPNLVVHGDIYASSVPGLEGDRSRLLLSKYPQVKAIFASGSPGAMAMLKVLSESGGSSQAKLVGGGFNLNPEVVAGLQSGKLAGWIAQLPQDVGAKGVESALALVNGQTVPAVVPTQFLVVTKANLSDPQVQSLLSL